ncbi:DedA family protein [Pseudonocardia ailaonensis]|uniref:DedA family protein n=1 Tax=Pseudonocardia ailaonensis TaxID=367279 RepID=A0ABN2NCP3_9PSEU
MSVDSILEAIPPIAVYLIVGLVVGVESLGIPLPGEIVLVSAALLSSQHELAVNPIGVGAVAVAGAVIGDSIGYLVGRRYGLALFEKLGRRFPKHAGPKHVALAERLFARWGMWAVFVGRFVALLRIFAGPLAGALGMHYPRFLIANVGGALAWAGGTTAAVYFLGLAAEKWLSRFSWIGLIVAVLVGLGVALVVRHRTEKLLDQEEDPTASTEPTSTP